MKKVCGNKSCNNNRTRNETQPQEQTRQVDNNAQTKHTDNNTDNTGRTETRDNGTSEGNTRDTTRHSSGARHNDVVGQRSNYHNCLSKTGAPVLKVYFKRSDYQVRNPKKP